MNIVWDSENYKNDFNFVPDYGESVTELLTVEKGGKVMDLGCGTGALIPTLVNKGYEVTGVEFEPQKVTLVGKHSLIDSLESIKVPKEDISVDGAKDTVNVEVNLNKYLPDGVSVSDSANAIATITVKVEKLETKKFQINKSDISLQNIESGYIAEISSDSISVSLTGLKSELDKVTPDDIKAVVNLKGINSNKTVDVSLTVPNNTTLKNKVSVKVKVTKK